MKLNMKNKIFFAIFMTVWVIIVIINFVWAKPIFSEEENRMLATIPRFSFESFVNGNYLNGVNDYINDHFAFRNFYLKLNSWWEVQIMGKKENNGVYIGEDGYLFEKVNFNENEQKNINESINTILNFSEKMEKINVPTYFMLIPNSIYINSDKLPNNVETLDQEKIINEIYNKSENTININVTKSLKKENENKQLYFKTDHHINSDGAYVVYTEFCKTANLPIINLNEFEKVILSDDFFGTFDSKAQLLNQESDTLFVYENTINTNIKEAIYDKEVTNSIFNENYLIGKDKYSYFLNGNNSRAIIKTNNANDKKLLVIKDSYAHIMSQFLCQDYNEVHFLDPRYTNFNYEEYVKKNGITDVLFLYNVSTFMQDTSISKIMPNV